MEDAYKTFERGTPAGDMLYKLYNGKKTMDSTLDRDLLQRLQEQRRRREAMLRPKPKVIPKSQTKINVPRPTGYVRNSDIHSCGRLGPPTTGKRLAPLAKDFKMPEPPPARKLLGEEEKERLASLMYQRQLPPLPTSATASPRYSQHKSRFEKRVAHIDTLKTQFSEMQQELSEQQAQLDTHTKSVHLPRSRKKEAALREAVANTITRLRSLDQLIQDEERLLGE
eukprot:TRINITY_DN35104_c0_g1_i1.p1 TRINITY_DN35104_c0_g1~~TRINITY_DN35104_c0_g1_i1.p1  ORF type:complete len:236 (+),score=62.35 TRINITY_DN35104_c0_g1_i1:35-709(+)